MPDAEKQQAVIEWLEAQQRELLTKADKLFGYFGREEEEDELRTVAAYLNWWKCELNGTWHANYDVDEQMRAEAVARLEAWKVLVSS